ncbi:glucose 1-dehydrogenase [Agrobacterium sp. SHOUNA12C]|jgi:NAD(P)-dependent dehydrogenase (short-subunit alcohol dehydrogenase family)|nr:glucose 1-dehydrogenase [Agrobacterium sp. BETTINA12B]MCJ9757071.1 glucose 1-dehydrogenase [Agrobacterium sp. SHOUNA12C]
MDGITGSVAVVTGAAQGNGKAIASGLARLGAKVALCDIQMEAVEALAEELTAAGLVARPYRLDVTDPEASRTVARAVATDFGPVSILVNNAGIIRRTLPDDETFEADWSLVLRVNADGPMYVARAFMDQLKATKGRIVNLGSIMSLSAGPGLAAYAASKGAVLQLTKALAHDFAPFGVRVNAIAPGVIETPMTEATRSNPDAIGRFMAHTPLKRPGQPDELVGPVLFLASHSSSYVTGVILPVDGGYLAA